MELIFVLAIALIILRPKRLSDAAWSLGRRIGLCEHVGPSRREEATRPGRRRP